MLCKQKKDKPKIARKTFLKGAVSAVLGVSGLGFYGYEAGKDPMTYTGCESFQRASHSFNRERFAVDERIKKIKIEEPKRLQEVLKYHRKAKQFWQQRLSLANAD